MYSVKCAVCTCVMYVVYMYMCGYMYLYPGDVVSYPVVCYVDVVVLVWHLL